jgi:hypothetical protein
VQRILGVDLTNPDIGTDPAIAAYAGPAYEIMGGGVFSETFAAQLQGVFAELAATDDKPASPRPHKTQPETAPTSKEDA